VFCVNVTALLAVSDVNAPVIKEDHPKAKY
jgi:hypothetical protein